MDFIKCTHCGKKFIVSEEIKASVGKFIECSSCQKDFLIVINSEKNDISVLKKQSDTSAQAWDPTKTMPPQSIGDMAPGSIREQSLKDDSKEGQKVLAALQAAKKKKLIVYIVSGLLVCLLVAILLFLFGNDKADDSSVVKQAIIQESAQVQDANNPMCRQEAAKQWMIDTKAMHSDYSGDEFVRILKRSQQQTALVQAECKQYTIIQDIIAAATAKEKPIWFEAEINALQAIRNR